MMDDVVVPTSRALVGRETELGLVRALLDAGPDGADGGTASEPVGSGSLLLSGDAGVGKTRLLMELRDLARAEGWQVHAGHCLDFGESALPYLPFSEVVGRIAQQAPDLLAAVAAERPQITRLQPGRRTRAAGGSDNSSDVEQTIDRAELFDAVHVLLDEAAALAPVLLVIEDMHWADQSTRDMLGFLFTRPFQNRVRIVASYRSDDLHRRHPLRRQAAEWSRLPGLARLALGPLEESAVRDLVAQLAPTGITETAVRGIVDRAEGNAFFVEELVASSGRDEVPDDLADLLLVRLDPLGDEARQVVRSVSAAGRRVTHELLAAVAELPADRLEIGIRQAVEMNVLEAGPRHYSFRHALLSEAVYDDLLPGERVRLHARYVTVIADGIASGTAADLARHARRAADLDRAATAGIEAGDEALAVGGPDEAARHYEQTLELLADPARVARLDIDLAKLVVKAADAIGLSGAPQRSVELLDEYIRRLPPAGESEAGDAARARLLSQYAGWLTIVDNDDDPLRLSREAAALAPADEGPLRAKVLAAHARVLQWSGAFDEAKAVGTEALALAERLALPALASEVSTTLGMAGGGDGDLRTALESAVRDAERAGAAYPAMRASYLLARSYQDDGDWDLAAQWFETAMDVGRRAGMPWAPYCLESRLQRALIAQLRGDWDLALDLVAAADGHAPPIPAAVMEPVRLEILAARGTDVAARLRRLRRYWTDESIVAVFSGGAEVSVAASAGDVDAAMAAYGAVVELLGRVWSEHFGGRTRLAALALGGISRVAATAPTAARPALAETADRLRVEGEETATFRMANGGWAIEGQSWTALLVAEHLRVLWLLDIDPPSREALLEAWRLAVAGFERFGHVPQTARTRASYAGVLRALGETAQADAEVDAAEEIARRLGDQTLLRDLAVSREAVKPRDLGPVRLTSREREILALVAEGRSNGEIGRVLFISTKTVSVHVSNILGKLGAAGRTEAAAIARREGLV